MENNVVYFDFRLINMPGGTQVIDESIKTPMDALTPEMQIEYMEVHEQLAFIKRMRKKERMEELHKRKIARNPLYRLACACGIV